MLALLSLVLVLAQAAAAATSAPPRRVVTITTAHATPRETQTRALLERILERYDLRDVTFTRQIAIEERSINHAFPVLTLNVRFADAEDDLLASYVHEQLHWHLRDRAAEMQRAVAALRRAYPSVPVGLPEGAETEYSTYGHLIDCYLESQMVRRLIGPERTAAAIARKGHYTWIYETIRRDEPQIAALVRDLRLDVR